MKYVLVPLDLIDPDPEQSRRTFRAIGELADSIRQHGLLQNLVLRQIDGGRYQIKAGERRYRALKKLQAEEGSPLPAGWDDWLVPALIKNDSDDWDNIIENVNRQSIYYWELGRRFLELIEAGHLQEEVARKINRSKGFVSLCITITKGLCPEVIARIVAAGVEVSQRQLQVIACYYDENGDPDVPAQLETLERFMVQMGGRPSWRNRTRTRRVRSTPETITARLYRLQTVPVPPRFRRCVTTIAAYLRGELPRIDWSAL